MAEYSVAGYSVAGRAFQWTEETSTQDAVTLQFTGWPAGTEAATFDAAATSGPLTCRMTRDLMPVNLTAPGADQSWAVTADLGGPPSYLPGSARVRDLIVSASLTAPTTGAATARSGEPAALLTAGVEDLDHLRDRRKTQPLRPEQQDRVVQSRGSCSAGLSLSPPDRSRRRSLRVRPACEPSL
ncbi:hypothetical protein [Kineococcus radiotolerans]|uniref:hypothetical protein n=1 Tax=Kineococcus radiotolerans TaxID=131568 RepID=UPI00003A3C42|nr:hypothetical protein [Kineococcus radiotolerans]